MGPLVAWWITSGRIGQSPRAQWLLWIYAGACLLSMLLIQGAALIVEAQARRARNLVKKAVLRGLERRFASAESPSAKHLPEPLPNTSSGERAKTGAAVEGFQQLGEQVLESVSEAVILVGADGLVVDVNSAAAGMLGYSREEAAGKQLKQLLLDEPDVCPEQRLDSYLFSGNWNLRGCRVNVRFARKDGSVFLAEVKLGECWQGSSKFFLVNWNDTTRSRQAELLSRDRMQIVEMIARNQPIDEVLASLAYMIERQLPGSRCLVTRRQGSQFFPAAAPSLPGSFVQSLKELPADSFSAACGAAAYEGSVTVVTDIALAPRWEDCREAALEHGLRSCWSAPVYTGEGMVAGTIVIYWREPQQPDAAQVELLKMASRLASMCMEQKESTGQLAYRAQHDALTGLPNRFTFEDRLKGALSHARRHGRILGILSVDMDRFKLVNDTLGHAAGDGVLQQVARRLAGCLRESDMVARWGGDEFMVGLLELADRQDAERVASKLMEAVKPPVDVEGHTVSTTVTIGISVYPDDGRNLEALIKNADKAMYKAKKAGTNSFQFCVPRRGEVERQRLDAEAQLRCALERGELLLHYQPQFDLRTGALAGLEALLRWNHPQQGLVQPADFLPIAEHNGLIVPIGAWTLRTACRQARELDRAGLGRLRIAVNVSGGQFAHPGFAQQVAAALEETGIEPSRLELELSEGLVMNNLSESVPRMAELRALGVRVALDDFGAAYQSLGDLPRLPIDTLKISQSLVGGLGDRSKTPLLAESIFALAQGLGIRATAGGVESQTQLSVLRTAGCDLAQGYLLGRPLPAGELQPSILWSFQDGLARPSLLHLVPRPSSSPDLSLTAA